MRQSLLAIPALLVATIALLQPPRLGAADPIPEATDSNENLAITARAYVGKEEIAKLLGLDPGVELVVVDVRIRPRGEGEIQVWHDDFTLISRKDGQRSTPLAPSQIAGQGALRVSSRGMSAGGSGPGNNQRGPIWGGGPGDIGGKPRRIGGEQESVSSSPSGADSKVDDKAKGDSEVLKILKAKALPEKKSTDELQGLLYYVMEGKHKLKQLELIYKSGGNRMILDFVK